MLQLCRRDNLLGTSSSFALESITLINLFEKTGKFITGMDDYNKCINYMHLDMLSYLYVNTEEKAML